jgi:para-nitrobenzyl esterase
MVDGVVIPEPPPQAWAEGKEAPVPYIAGGNSWEASLFPQAAKDPERVLARLGPARAAVMAAYGSSDPASVAQDLTTETTVVEPDRHLARLHMQHGHKAWNYYFSYLPAAERGQVHGLNHGGEILYVFGNLPDQPRTFAGRTLPAATSEDRAISDAAIAYWVAFAKASDPDSAGGPLWPPAQPGDVVMEFGAGGPRAVPHFHAQTLDIAEKIAERR